MGNPCVRHECYSLNNVITNGPLLLFAFRALFQYIKGITASALKGKKVTLNTPHADVLVGFRKSPGFLIPLRGFQILGMGFLFVGGTWIPDFSRWRDSGFVGLCPAFQSLGFRK